MRQIIHNNVSQHRITRQFGCDSDSGYYPLKINGVNQSISDIGLIFKEEIE
jgi:hypothetical protein